MIRFTLDTFMNNHNLSIQDVINATGISRPTISQYYNGKAKGIQFETLDKIMTGLNAEIYELFDTVFPKEHLRYTIEPINHEKNSPIISEDEPTVQATFLYEENINVKNKGFTLTSFFMPLFVTEQKTHGLKTLSIECTYDSIDAVGGEDTYQETQLISFLNRTEGSFLEGIMGSIALDIVELIKPKISYDNVLFKSDITNGTNNPSFNGYAFAYAWTYDTIKDRNAFSNWIDLKYGEI